MSTIEFYLRFNIVFFFLLPSEVFGFGYIKKKKSSILIFRNNLFFIKIQKGIYCSTEENAIPFLVVGSQ